MRDATMTNHAAMSQGRALDLPPLFTAIAAERSAAVHAEACGLAAPEAAGTIVHALSGDCPAFAVVLAPDEPLATARRAFIAGMVALGEAVGAHAPPERAVRFGYPDAILFNEARIGGGRLSWPADCPEHEAPAWLVFSAMLIGTKRDAGDPGLTPETSSLEEEGFEIADRGVLVESFARYLMRAVEAWNGQGFEAVAAAFSDQLIPDLSGAGQHVDATGDLLTEDAGASGGLRRDSLAVALRTVSWLDATTGRPRL
ncbi:biotin/lipoate--protein ligase family protein [Methylobacterium durans]|uniref:biotin/lipoate--protein ligase family protein n=1 Tax=Methylobacterium durans TaxID=2202825 RepID=UPI002AFE8D25|nr:biotin/lipoate--protein ligase family protein [Methylobacterium durans]MEA1833306.1 biotin/lipoate--protein ligase family protein [Methylobacterium durans]